MKQISFKKFKGNCKAAIAPVFRDGKTGCQKLILIPGRKILCSRKNCPEYNKLDDVDRVRNLSAMDKLFLNQLPCGPVKNG